MKRRTLLTKMMPAALMASFVGTEIGAGAIAAASRPTSAADTQRAYEQPGPHQVTRMLGPDHTFYYREDLKASGSSHPVILWGNGTGASVDQYDSVLRHLASWGFVVAAANTGQSGSGQEMLAGGTFLIAENVRAGSVFEGRIDTAGIGAAGHSQGGGGAIAAGADPMVKVTAPLQPGPQGVVSALRGPSLFVAGQLDYIVPSIYVRARFAQARKYPAVFAELRGSDHFFPGDTRIRATGVLTAWFRYWLTNDAQAKTVFFGPEATAELYNDTAWSDVDRNQSADVIR
jgi:pimeloyl-ACP methyl ester carboxylesterase